MSPNANVIKMPTKFNFCRNISTFTVGAIIKFNLIWTFELNGLWTASWMQYSAMPAWSCCVWELLKASIHWHIRRGRSGVQNPTTLQYIGIVNTCFSYGHSSFLASFKEKLRMLLLKYNYIMLASSKLQGTHFPVLFEYILDGPAQISSDRHILQWRTYRE